MNFNQYSQCHLRMSQATWMDRFYPTVEHLVPSTISRRRSGDVLLSNLRHHIPYTQFIKTEEEK